MDGYLHRPFEASDLPENRAVSSSHVRRRCEVSAPTLPIFVSGAVRDEGPSLVDRLVLKRPLWANAKEHCLSVAMMVFLRSAHGVSRTAPVRQVCIRRRFMMLK